MGLCKCPQRKVTNIFCYEHRVNVCEHCLVQNHPQCVVDTYRNWITDSVYTTTCGLCEEELNKSDTIRLLCLHIVHWDCLDSWARSLPLTTAPAGYTCPICKKMCLFPQINQVSPIADGLRKKMGEVNWARAGLGLPLLDQDTAPKKQLFNGNGNNNQVNLTNGYDPYDGSNVNTISNHTNTQYSVPSSSTQSNVNPHHLHHTPSKTGFSYSQLQPNHNPTPIQNSHYGGNDLGSPTAAVVGETTLSSSRKGISRTDFSTPLLIDEDDNKYRRRSPFESLSRWLKTYSSSASRRNTRKRTALYAIIAIVVLIILFMILFGRSSDSSLDEFNPQANPNVIIGHGKGIQHEAEIET